MYVREGFEGRGGRGKRRGLGRNRRLDSPTPNPIPRFSLIVTLQQIE